MAGKTQPIRESSRWKGHTARLPDDFAPARLEAAAQRPSFGVRLAPQNRFKLTP
jgi:hypothetical protein